MRKHWIYNLRWATVLLVLFSACNSHDRAIREMCQDIHSRYPKATLQDIYKTCYQDYYGAEHLMTDTAAARMYLHTELEEWYGTDMSAMPKEEPTGFRHRFVRVNLSEIYDGELTEDQLLAMFIEAAGKDNAFSNNWAAEWDMIVKVALKVNPKWSDPELQSELEEAARTNHAVRHSDAFRNAYNPHYRIVKRR